MQGADKDRRRASSGAARGLPVGRTATENKLESALHVRMAIGECLRRSPCSARSAASPTARFPQPSRACSGWPSEKTFLNSKAGCELWLRAYTLRSPGTMNESDALDCGRRPEATVAPGAGVRQDAAFGSLSSAKRSACASLNSTPSRGSPTAAMTGARGSPAPIASPVFAIC